MWSVISPTVPLPVPHCSTTAVYNGSSNELTNIVVNWSKAEVSLECFIMNSGIPMCVHEYCRAIHVYVNINEPHLPENGRSSYKATLCSSTICACDLVNVWNLVTEHSMMKYTTLFDCKPLPPPTSTWHHLCKKCSQAFSIFHHSSASMYHQRAKMGEAWEQAFSCPKSPIHLHL